jgi:pimeloyl-ACP methyl ester carboxylesterase
MALFLREAGGVDDLDALPVWPDEVNLHLAGTVVRENRAVERYGLPDRLDLSARTLLLRSEYGPEHLRDGVRALHDALAGSRLVDLEGVGHVGTASAPERVADAVRPFLRGESDRPGEVGVTE